MWFSCVLPRIIKSVAAALEQQMSQNRLRAAELRRHPIYKRVVSWATVHTPPYSRKAITPKLDQLFALRVSFLQDETGLFFFKICTTQSKTLSLKMFSSCLSCRCAGRTCPGRFQCLGLMDEIPVKCYPRLKTIHREILMTLEWESTRTLIFPLLI